MAAYYYDELIEPILKDLYSASKDGDFLRFRGILGELLRCHYLEYYDTLISAGGEETLCALLNMLQDAWTEYIWSELDVRAADFYDPPTKTGMYLTNLGIMMVADDECGLSWALLNSDGVFWPTRRHAPEDLTWSAEIPYNYAAQIALDFACVAQTH